LPKSISDDGQKKFDNLDNRKDYETALNAYKPQKKKKDPNAPKQPLSAYFLFSQEERLKVKNENPNFSICEVAKELGRRWAEMAPEVKQRYQQGPML
jgi:hypothetical protein